MSVWYKAVIYEVTAWAPGSNEAQWVDLTQNELSARSLKLLRIHLAMVYGVSPDSVTWNGSDLNIVMFYNIAEGRRATAEEIRGWSLLGKSNLYRLYLHGSIYKTEGVTDEGLW